MSHKVVTLVCSRIVGSAAQKAVLTNMADKASDGGEGVFASKATIAAETELSLPTVKREIKALIHLGLIREVGSRACANGHTVVYDMDLGAIAALPEWKTGRRIGAEKPKTGFTTNPVQGEPGSPRTPTRFRVNPHPVQGEPLTVLEPSLNKEAAVTRARAREGLPLSLVSQIADALGFNDPDGKGWPKYWAAADAHIIASRWITDLGLTASEVIEVAVSNAKAHGTPANGPKTLTRHMQDFAAAKSAPPLTPSAPATQFSARPTTGHGIKAQIPEEYLK